MHIAFAWKKWKLIGAMPLLAWSLSVAQNTIHVPADQPGIQQAINVAVNGDTVLVSPGNYFENINFFGKAITVVSSDGPSVTTISRGSAGALVTFQFGETSSSVLKGFTIQGGLNLSAAGGGISIIGSSPTIDGNVITQNQACEGAGVYLQASSAIIQNNKITNNNDAQLRCGATRGGGGILVAGTGTPLVINNVIQGNSIGSNGGGISIEDQSDVNIIQNLVAQNTSGSSGGGIAWNVPSGGRGPLLVNNTISANHASVGAGIYSAGFVSNVNLVNNIVVGEEQNGTPYDPTAMVCDSAASSTSPTFSFNDFYSAIVSAAGPIVIVAPSFQGSCVDPAGTSGNISQDPLLTSFLPSPLFHLTGTSPAIDAGTNTAPGLPQTDLDGNARIAAGKGVCSAPPPPVVDMGAYEFIATPSVSLTPSSLSFGLVPVGTASATQTATLSANAGCVAISSITITGDFAQSNDCPAQLAAGSSCTLQVWFAPTSTGSVIRSLTFTGNFQGPVVTSLSGTGAAAVANLSPAILNFPSQLVGTISAAQAVSLFNSGNLALQINAFSVTGEYGQTNNCPASLAPGTGCSINVTFTPSAAGTRSGTLTVNGNGGSPLVSLNGTGIAPLLSASPASLSFANQLVTTTSSAQTVTLNNTGSAPLHVSSITITGDFAQTNTCTASLAVGASCSVNVTFTPTVSGARSGFLNIVSDGGPATIALNGTGVVPIISVAPTSLSFANQLVNTTSGAQVVTITNSGTAPLHVSSATTAGDFAQSNTCAAALAVGASCSVNVTFTPTASGARSGSLNIASDGGSATITLSGTGIAPVLSATPTSLSFANQLVNTTSGAQVVTITNSGSAPLQVSSITVTGDFAQTNTCAASLAVGASCSVNVTFTPTASGARSGSLNIVGDGGPATITLSGTGIAPLLSATPASLSFANQLVNTTSGAQVVTITNSGSAPLQVSSITVTGDFAQTNTCAASLAVGASCSVNVTFTPTASGARSGGLNISSDGGPATITLSGTGIAPVISVSPNSLSFAGQLINTTSGAQAVTLSNTGTANLQILSISTSGDFAQTNNCPASLAMATSCVINLTFTPAARFARNGSLVIQGAAPAGNTTLPLTGTGLAPVPAFSSASLSFGNQHVAVASVPQIVTLTNSGDGNFLISGLSVTGTDFSQSNNCPAVLAPSQSCSASITFDPGSRGLKTSTLSVNTTQQVSVPAVSLSGTGVLPVASLTASLSFAAQMTGTTSTHSATLANNGDGPLTISSITTSGDYSQTSNCPSSVAPGGSCVIQVSFSPTAAGTRNGSLTVHDDDVSNQQTTALTGTGIDYGLSESPASVTISAGQTANYNVTVKAVNGNYSKAVSLACGGLPAASSCLFSPASVTPGTNSANSHLSIVTTKGTTATGTYTITVTGSSGTAQRAVALQLVVK